MSNPGDPITGWESLAIAADQGRLSLKPEAAEVCRNACEAYLAQLAEHRARAVELADVDALAWMDGFESGKELRGKFAEKAAGGKNNLVDVLQSHIDVVERMRIVFDKLLAATAAVDDSTSIEMSSQGPK
ncbi:hypothetical protein [Rhodococcoides kyotonense]|uniref:Uncharacterized protein n=1 Tax=Rhodococcoides kyotonense TaxID=398843 RepID=A0A239IMM0_9NOCA|nr:hypothetical protein [Rhodococcus kyotonensis]SNS94799.1 hypothetical protein SAMN05421642_107131 [Rhodococcus kyotonensis]